MSVWNAIEYTDVIHNVPRQPLPDCNRGSWYCPVATKDDAEALDVLCQKHGVNRVYDLGAGTLELSVAMDQRGYDVIAYESMQDLVDFASERLPDHGVEVRSKDYYSEWKRIKNERAAFVALGKVNCVPGNAPNGFVVDGMEVEQ